MLEVIILLPLVAFLPRQGPYFLGLLLLFALFLPGFLRAARHGAPFVPTSRATLKKMMRLAKIKHGERVYDLGCGDGRLVRAAAEAGATATGYEVSLPTAGPSPETS